MDKYRPCFAFGIRIGQSSIPLAGNGVIATVELLPGTIILIERFEEKMNHLTRFQIQLPDHSSYIMEEPPGGYHIGGKIYTFDWQNDLSKVFIPVLGMFNHSDRPNVAFLISPATYSKIYPFLKEYGLDKSVISVIITTCLVQSGEELLLNYYPHTIPFRRGQRQMALRQHGIQHSAPFTQQEAKYRRQLAKIDQQGWNRFKAMTEMT